MKVDEATVQAFIRRQFEPAQARLLTDDRLAGFLAAARAGHDVRAAQEYAAATGAALEECHLAVSFARSLDA